MKLIEISAKQMIKKIHVEKSNVKTNHHLFSTSFFGGDYFNFFIVD